GPFVHPHAAKKYDVVVLQVFGAYRSALFEQDSATGGTKQGGHASETDRLSHSGELIGGQHKPPGVVFDHELVADGIVDVFGLLRSEVQRVLEDHVGVSRVCEAIDGGVAQHEQGLIVVSQERNPDRPQLLGFVCQRRISRVGSKIYV